MFTPAYAHAYRDLAFVVQRTAASFWAAFSPHRDVSSTLGISALLHLAVFVIFGSAMYTDGEDDRNVPELSVQLETRAGPNDEEFTEAALPELAPDPVEDVIDDPGTLRQPLDAATLADAIPLEERIPDAPVADVIEAENFAPAEPGALVTTTAPSQDVVAVAPEPSSKPHAEVSQPEQTMLTRNVQQLAQKLLDSNMTDTELIWQEDGKQYSARVMRQPAPDSTGIEQVIAEVMTHKDGKRMKTRLSLKRLAFSHFTQLVNNWDRNIQLHDDVIDGRFHSNTEFAFTTTRDATPRFFGKVTTAAATLTYSGFNNKRRNKEVFQGGFETKTEKVVLPREMPDVLNGGSDAHRHVFTGDTRIIFNADGSFAWRHANGEGSLNREEASDEPCYLIGEKGAKLFVRGTVSGLFTVYTPNDIEIEDDVVYARDPRQAVMSRDFLALIAGRDVIIGRPEVTGPGDLTVHGAIFARRRFYIEYTDRGRSGDATLLVYGSLTAGTLSETEPRYATKIDFDKRFEYLRPASFPMTRRYEVDAWDQDWVEVENPDPPSGSLALSN